MPRVAIVTLADKRPDFIEIQLRSFEKHLTGDFEFMVLNNAFDRSRSLAIESECLRLGLREVKVRFSKKLAKAHGERAFKFGRYSNPNLACSYAMQWFWNEVLPGLKEKNLVFIDSDMFLMGTLNVQELLGDAALAYIPQFRGSNLEIEYPWNGIVVADLSRDLPFQAMDWHPGSVSGIPCDVGGQNHFWLRSHVSSEKVLELAAFTVYGVDRTTVGWSSHVAINGNWNINLHFDETKNSYLHDFSGFEGNVPDPRTLALPRRLFGSMWEIKNIYEPIRQLIDIQNVYDFPSPAYFDLIGRYVAGKLEPFIFHYKSGSNYQTWATDKYNHEKTEVLKRLVLEV